MSFRKKLARMKPHLSSERGIPQQGPGDKPSNSQIVPFIEVWEKEHTKPYFYDGSYCLIREKEFSLDEKFGKYSFSQFLDAVKAWNGTGYSHPLSTKGFKPEQLFFFDTETTGLGGGTGNTIFLLGYAYFKGEKIVLRQHLLPHPGAEVPLYQSFLEGIDYTTLVTYNGKAFDWPQVKTRHTLIREHVPQLPAFGHFDLFHAARRLWKHKLERLRLAVVEKEVLGIERIDDIPGFLAPMIYFDFVENQKPDGILGILKHNEMDILSLIPLYTHITFQLLNMDEKRSVSEGYEVGRWYSSLGETTAATETLSLYKDADEASAIGVKYALSLEWKKQGQWKEACHHWVELMDSPNEEISFQSSIELAKYHEHKVKDLRKALGFANRAMHILKDRLDDVGGQRMAELQKRISRLEEKGRKMKRRNRDSSIS